MFDYSLSYIEIHTPKLVTLEQVSTITHKKHTWVLQKIKATLQEAGYEVRMKIMNCMHFGVPQKRLRFFLVACHKGFGSSFKWPRRCKFTKTLPTIIKASKHDNPRTLPSSRDGLRMRELVKLRYKLHVGRGINPLETMVITDIGCSKSLQRRLSSTLHWVCFPVSQLLAGRAAISGAHCVAGQSPSRSCLSFRAWTSTCRTGSHHGKKSMSVLRTHRWGRWLAMQSR